ncbi:GTP-binding protein Rab-3D-like, partial [Clarias magur]
MVKMATVNDPRQQAQVQKDAADQNFDFMFKLLIIGNSSVGKTSFLFRYADDSFTSAFVSTVGIDFKVKTVYRNEKRIKLQIWDTAGQERYRTITTAYYRGAMGFLLMYDITNQESFYAVQDWATQIKTYSWDNAQVILVGNKCDLEDDRLVATEDGQKLANELGPTNVKMCCSGFLKIMMFIFNGVIFLAGAAVLGVGIWVTVDSSSMLEMLANIKDAPPQLAQLANVGYLLIGIGAVLTIMGFLGCCGAITENKCMLLTFFIIVLIIFIAEVAGAILVLVFQPLVAEILGSLNEKFVEAIREEYGNNSDFSTVFNSTMTQLKCCGYNNYTDFTGSPFVASSNRYPMTCCSESTSVCSLSEAQNE